MQRKDLEERIREILREAPQHVQEIVSEVLSIEEDNLHSKAPRVKDEILQVIKRVVK